jgi:hypothetical protein
MCIRIVRHINSDENDRVEFLFVNYDYFDGNELVAKLLFQEFGMLVDERIDGIFYSIIKLHKGSKEYNLIWHEDVGNYIFVTQKDEHSINELERWLEIIVSKLNERVKKQP